MNLPGPPELLPCPFCGTKPMHVYETRDGAEIHCARCDFTFAHNGPHSVTKAWNTRPGELEAIRGFAKRLRGRAEAEGEDEGYLDEELAAAMEKPE